MVELRRSPRINVTWRGIVKLDDGDLIPIRAMNVSSTGILLHCNHALHANKEYQIMLEIPHIDQVSNALYRVPAKVQILHCILSGEAFRIGVRFVEVAEIHRDLVRAWVSLVSVFDPPSEN
jgi:c-di-GMP-binding flagellar brake protein YcgR